MPMLAHNPQNERIKRAYFTYLAEAKGFSEAPRWRAKALHRFETYTRFRDFKAFHIEQARASRHILLTKRAYEPPSRSARRPSTLR